MEKQFTECVVEEKKIGFKNLNWICQMGIIGGVIYASLFLIGVIIGFATGV